MAWTAELTVDEALARRLIGSQFPDLADEPIQLLGEGWDMTAWLLGGGVVFRFPRREIVVPGLEREIAVLPRIAAGLPLPIPVPTRMGRPEAGYPWPFSGATYLPGSELMEADLDAGARDALAQPLAEFLRALHGLPAPEGLPVDPMGRADMGVRVPRTRETLADLAAAGVWSAPALVDELLEAATDLPPAKGQVLVHGDLHIRHLLVEGGRASAVIDWIDVCQAPRAVDLVLYWALFGSAGRAAFQATYGELHEDELLRARVLSLNLCGILALYAHREGFPPLLKEALIGLESTVRS